MTRPEIFATVWSSPLILWFRKMWGLLMAGKFSKAANNIRRIMEVIEQENEE